MIETFIPCSEVPKTYKAGCGTDNFYDKNVLAPFAHLSPKVKEICDHHKTVYRWNSHGYRCAEFSERRDLNVISIGCSWVMGAGLEEDETFPQLFGRLLAKEYGVSVANWNLGFGGKANDYMARVLMSAAPVLKPDLVFVNFTHRGRREYVGPDGKVLDFQHNFLDLEEQGLLKWTRVNREIITHLVGLTSEHEDDLNFIRNYRLIEAVLDKVGALWLFSDVHPPGLRRLLPWLDASRFVETGIRLYDRAHDESHPGPVSNRIFALELLNRFRDRHGAELVDRLAARGLGPGRGQAGRDGV